jgi:uncharacterized protein YqgC (DUF456 family)
LSVFYQGRFFVVPKALGTPQNDKQIARDILLWQVVTVIFMLAGLVSILIGIPGTFIILGAVFVYSACTHFEVVSMRLLVGLLSIAMTGEIIEAFLGLFVARKFGASRLALFSTLIGGFAGAVIGSLALPLIGTVIGAVAGAFLGAFIPEMALKRGVERSVSAGMGVFIGRTGAVFAKLFLGTVMIALVVVSFCR